MQEKSKRILILTTAYLPQVGGSELAIKNITERLPEYTFDLITSRFSTGVPTHEKIGNVNVYRVGNSFSKLSFLLPKNFLPISIFSQARQLIRQHGEYDVIHAYQASQAAGAGWLLKWIYPKTPFVVTVQEGKDLARQSVLTKFFRYLIFKKSDHATAISNYLAQYVTSQNKRVPVIVIPNGVDTNMFKMNDTILNNHNVISVSRLVEKNAVDDLINAMSLVVKKIPDAYLIIVGDGVEKKNLMHTVHAHKIEHQVEFVGEVSNERLPEYFAHARVFVRPSLSEGLGISFLEAMASGVPIIATRVGGIPDFLVDRQTGLYCNVGDSADIAEKIITILSDKDIHDTLAWNGRKLVQEKYDWQIIAEQFRNFYGSITK